MCALYTSTASFSSEHKMKLLGVAEEKSSALISFFPLPLFLVNLSSE
jgi:hypothetical protein